LQGRVVVFLAYHVEQLAAVGGLLVQVFQGDDDAFQELLFLAQFLGVLGVVPDVGVFEFPGDFG
jgi:hypothetical protein